MSELDKAHDHLGQLIKGTLEINPGLESILAIKPVKKISKDLEAAFHKQIEALLKSDVWKKIDAAIGPPSHPITKADKIPTESDDLELYDAVYGAITPVGNQKQDDRRFSDMFADFMLLIFNYGGQDFLNQQNIPATFELTNPAVIDHVKSTSGTVLKGVDETTTKWIVDQIKAGRDAGLTHPEIADTIREAVPPTYANRAETIVRTETSRMVGESQHITAQNNGASHKEWLTVGGACPICVANEDAGQIGIQEAFPSGDTWVPAHPNCKCKCEYVFTPFMGSIWHGQ